MYGSGNASLSFSSSSVFSCPWVNVYKVRRRSSQNSLERQDLQLIRLSTYHLAFSFERLSNIPHILVFHIVCVTFTNRLHGLFIWAYLRICGLISFVLRSTAKDGLRGFVFMQNLKYGFAKEDFAESHHSGRFWCWQDIINESICQPQIFQPIQGYHWSRFPHKGSHGWWSSCDHAG